MRVNTIDINEVVGTKHASHYLGRAVLGEVKPIKMVSIYLCNKQRATRHVISILV